MTGAERDVTSAASSEIQDEYSKRLEEKRILTSQISDNCRFVSIALLAAYYATIATQGEGDDHGWWQKLRLLSFAGFGVVALVFVRLQYVFAVRLVNRAIDSPDLQHKFRKSWIEYKLREFFFVAKQVCVVMGAALLVAFMVVHR